MNLIRLWVEIGIPKQDIGRNIIIYYIQVLRIFSVEIPLGPRSGLRLITNTNTLETLIL